MSLTRVEQSLLLAAYFRGMRHDENGSRSNSDQIVTLSLFYTGDLSPEECASRFVSRTQHVSPDAPEEFADQCITWGYVLKLYGESGELVSAIATRYRELIKLLGEHPDLIQGGGNFWTPADPTFTSCRLTQAGTELIPAIIDSFPTKPEFPNWPDKRPSPGTQSTQQVATESKVPFIPDSNSEVRMAGLERFLERYLGPRSPEFGASEAEVASTQMPVPLQRFFRFAGRWPGPGRFCIQDTLCGVVGREGKPALSLMDGRLVFVWENQSVWVAATAPTGADPPVWISEECSHRMSRQTWRQLENPLSHFLVSFVLQEVMFGSHLVATASDVLQKFAEAGLPVEPIWLNGEYARTIDRPSYYLVGDRFLVRRAPNEANGDDWYGCKDTTGASVLVSLGLPNTIE